MKICHPDVAGDDGEEVCILLNDAYDVLSNEEEKKAYDIELVQRNGSKEPVFVDDDLSPTWDWTSKAGNKKEKPVYNGRPLSRSLYHKVEDKGPKHDEEKFVFVDEWTCIACRNCCDVAPKTFCIDADAGRARVFAQWGNGEELLDYAVQSCPVDCIYWVSREELQALEYVTRDRMFENGNQPPCSMAARQGTGGGTDDPFRMATGFMAKRAEEKRRQEALGEGSENFGAMQERIRELFSRLSERLRRAGWG
ncbi:DJC76 [Symbiodinium natans]|uniref:DJC76 protein n=1 Tax=Symbiodinium natans TaxID=878477 RepID=A0A812L2T3_9DINO|nr:DJC76 [Symbiodinium natans]